MDRNTLIGIALIVLLFVLYTKMNPPEEKAPEKEKVENTDKTPAPADTAASKDSIIAAEPKKEYGKYDTLTTGTVQKVEVKTEELRLSISNKGGMPESIYLNNFKTYDGKPLPMLTKSDRNQMHLTIPFDGKVIETKDLFFTYAGPKKVELKGSDKKDITFRANVDSASYIEYIYHLKGSGYGLDFEVKLVNMRNYITSNRVEWFTGMEVPSTEKDADKMVPKVNIMYGLNQEDIEIEKLDMSTDEAVQEDVNFSSKWIAFKSQFFQMTFIAKDKLGNSRLTTRPVKESRKDRVVKYMSANIALPYNGLPSESMMTTWYIGPNDINILDDYNVDLDHTVELGWGPLRYITLFIVSIFNLLEGMTGSYGLIILILALFIKMILLPLTLKSHKSMVKMQIVNQMPEVKDLEAKYKGQTTELQQKKMAFYRTVGVSPFGGCLPMILQLPILISMFNFFPESIELRQQTLFWADDLSTYDSIWDFGYVPVINTIYGDHVSLFTLLMTLSTLTYTIMQQRMQGSAMGGAANMKWLSYMMPIMFLGILNNYAAALSYYYFVFNLLTISQTYILKAVISKESLEAKVHETRKKKGAKPKGKMGGWLERQQKKQEQVMRERRQQQNKKGGGGKKKK